MRFSNWLIGIVVAALFAAAWFAMNQPMLEDEWDGDVNSLSYAPWRGDETPLTGKQPSIEEVTADLNLIAGRTRAIRTYEATGISAEIPKLAGEIGLNVTAGATIGNDEKKNEEEIANLAAISRIGSVNQLIVGNEVLLTNGLEGLVGAANQAELQAIADDKQRARRLADLQRDKLIDYIERVKLATGMPVSTAEPFHIWLACDEDKLAEIRKSLDLDSQQLSCETARESPLLRDRVLLNKKLADAVDYLTVHILSYWNGVPVEEAVKATIDLYGQIQRAYPDKRILIGEVGWPSEGMARKDKDSAYGARVAEASPVAQGIFVRQFLIEAKKRNIDYNIVEAFDQPWKAKTEGGVGPYWGLWDAGRQAKPELKGQLINYQYWRYLAAATIILGLPFALWIMRTELLLNRRGRLFVSILGCGSVMTAVWIYAQYSKLYLTWFDLVALVMVAPATLLLLAIFLIEGVEMAVNLWLGTTRRRLSPPRVPSRWKLPRVSVHVPCYNEPPEMMIDTIKALERLDYPNYEVLIIDNNTKDDAVWQPVEAYIKSLGKPNFRFYHLPKWPGFKAGALNFALTVTDPEAEVIATIDSDYLVKSSWLSDLTPHFADPQVALVQAPQDYRDGHEDLFKRMCFWEYAGFFYLGMKTRDEKNAIIQHGTMALIRKSALAEAGGWAEWCITEDAELGLRLFEAGHRAVYTEKSYGRGLMPDSFEAYRKQRYRWAYGAMQILKHHWRDLMPFRKGGLNPAQRYQFLAGWLPWIADGLQLSFVALAVAWTIGMLWRPDLVQPPLTLYLFVTLSMFFFKVGKSVWLYSRKVPCGVMDNIGASIAGLAVSYAVAKAVWRGIFTSNLPFHRTPKMDNAPAIIRALVSAREETLICAALVGSGIVIALERGSFEPAAMLWAVLLCVQALPFFAALVMSIINAMPRSKQAAAPLPAVALPGLGAGPHPAGPHPASPSPTTPIATDPPPRPDADAA